MESMKAAHVVYVDDEPAVCRAVHKTLKRAGADVRCFQCPATVWSTWPSIGATC